MYFITRGRTIDYDLELLSKLLGVIDQQLNEFEERFQSFEEADAFGEFDWAEHIAGFGFVACQTYISATYPCSRMTKREALERKPFQEPSGQPVVAILNAAANFWKHNPEWPLERSSARQDVIRLAFEDLGHPADGEYPLSGLLTELTAGSARFGGILPLLRDWRDELIKYEGQQCPTVDVLKVQPEK